MQHFRRDAPLASGQGEAGIALDFLALFVDHEALIDIQAKIVRRFHHIPVPGINGGGEALKGIRRTVVIVVKNQAVKENVETPAHLQVKAGAVGRFPSLRGILLGICKAPAWHHAHKGFLAAYLLDGSLGSAVGKAKVVVNQSHLSPPAASSRGRDCLFHSQAEQCTEAR